MTLAADTFSNIITFSRATGKTRINSAGLLVGIDFSSTSNVLGTGSKSFTLAADASVNRDWSVGDLVLATDQVNGGTMNGTVTSYTSSTQVLVVNVTAFTGSGTKTNWRIGNCSPKVGYDPVTLLPRGINVEEQASNIFGYSEIFDSTKWSYESGTTSSLTTSSTVNNPSGSKAQVFTWTSSTTGGFNRGQGTGYSHVSIVAKAVDSTAPWISIGADNAAVWYDVLNGVVGTISGSAAAGGSPTIVSIGNGWYRVTLACSGYPTFRPALRNNNSNSSVSGDSMYLFGAQACTTGRVSYIPTNNGSSVTKAPDLAAVDSTRFSKFFKQSEGTIYLKARSKQLSDGSWALAAGFGDGTLNDSTSLARLSTSSRAFVSDAIAAPVTPLLDTYGSASCAYSTRLLRTAYAGQCLRIRRSSDNAEQDIGFVSGAIDESAITTFVGANSAFVVTWYDQSGNARDITQTTTTRQPRIVNAGVIDKRNGKVAPIFDGSNDYLIMSSTVPAQSTYSCFAVSRTETAGGYLIAGDNASAGFADSTGPYIVRLNQVGFASTTIPAGRLTQHSYLTTTTGTAVYDSGGLPVTTSGNPNFTVVIATVGSDNNPLHQGPYGGPISEIVLYSSDQSANRSAIEDHQMGYFGIGKYQADLTAGTWANDTSAVIVLAYKANDIAISINGAAVVTDTSATMPTPDRMSIGMSGLLANYWNGVIEKIGYRTSRMSNANVVACSSGSVDFFQSGSIS